MKKPLLVQATLPRVVSTDEEIELPVTVFALEDGVGKGTYEAKSQGAYVDPQRDVEVVGFENFSVIVKTIK